jgi:putative hydroxymethylpyrimidine transport system permease protein
MTRSLGRWWPPLALLAGAIGLWEIVVRAAHVPDYLFPAPSAILSSLHRDGGLLASATLVTLREMVLGYLLAVVVAVAIAVVLHFSAALRRALLPLLVLSQTVPTVLLAPILAILLGYGIEPKLVVVAIVCFFPIVVNAVDGLRSADPELVRMMWTLHGRRLAIFRRVELPGALPAIFSGARIAATYAAVGAVFGEWAGSSSGLGFVILQAQPALDTARIFAAVVVLSALALALYALVTLTERILVPWQPKAPYV